MKLWQGRFDEESDPVFEKMNRSLGIDAVLLDVDIRASRAHARSLLGCGVLTQEEWKAIDQGLEQILSEYTPEQVKATPYEDIHTFVEATLASKIGPAAGKLLILISIIAQLFCGMASVTANSRMIYAFSRDGAVPGHRLWHRINPKTRTPTKPERSSMIRRVWNASSSLSLRSGISWMTRRNSP